MSFELKVKQFIEKEQLLQQDDHLLIAVSGGVDSMALLHYFIKTKEQWGITLEAVHVDHMLRGEDSAEDRRFVQQFCKSHHIPLHSTAIPIPNILAAENGNSQLICRRERYQYFKEVMHKIHANKLVTAHHADDQIESVLMALTKNATINSMQGIRSTRRFEKKSLIRPFLTVTKLEIREYLHKQGLSYREDASNNQDGYLRNRYRHHIVPLLKAENPRVAEQVSHFTKQLQEDDELLMTLASETFSKIVEKNSDNTYCLEIKAFQMMPLALQRRVVLILLNYLYKDSSTIQSYTLMTSLIKLCDTIDGYAEVHLPEGFIAIRRYEKLMVQKSESRFINKMKSPMLLSLASGWVKLPNGMRLNIVELSNLKQQSINNSAQLFYFNASKLPLPLTIRVRQDGDRIRIKGMDQSKRLSRLFIDEKIPLNERNSWPLLVSQNNEVVAVIGVRMSEYFSTTIRKTDDTVLILDK